MDMSLEDTLAALGLEDEATVSPRTGGDGGGNSLPIHIGWSGIYRGDFTLPPETVCRAGALLVLQVGGLGLRAVILASRICGLRGLRGLLRMIGASAARHTARPPLRVLLRQPLGNVQQV